MDRAAFMNNLNVIFLGIHVFSLLFWIGSLVSITRVLAMGVGENEMVRAKLASTARKIYRSVASPWMGFALLTGLGMIGLAGGSHFRMGWFHGKFTSALLMLVIHFVLGSRVRTAEAKGLTDEIANGARTLQLGVLVVSALAIVCVVILKNLH
jgi:uncharacterized membrane protein